MFRQQALTLARQATLRSLAGFKAEQRHLSQQSRFLSSFLADNPEMPGPMTTRIENKLREALNPSFLEIIDDSAKHAGHAAMKGLPKGETHFRVTAVSSAFEGKRPVQRHQFVYQILDAELKEGLHALSLTTKTPEEYKA